MFVFSVKNKVMGLRKSLKGHYGFILFRNPVSDRDNPNCLVSMKDSRFLLVQNNAAYVR